MLWCFVGLPKRGSILPSFVQLFVQICERYNVKIIYLWKFQNIYYLWKLQNIFIKIAEYICQNCRMYFLAFLNVFVVVFCWFAKDSIHFREGTTYHFSCFFIKFINGLWPPPPPRFIKLRCNFLKTLLRLFFHWIWFLDIQNRFYFIVKRLKNSFLMPQKTFSMPISCCQSPPEYTKFPIIIFIGPR